MINQNACQFQGATNFGPLALGAMATWDGTVQTLMAFPPGASILMVFHIVARGAVGSQPLLLTFKVGTTVLASGVSLFAALAGGQGAILPLTSQLITVPTSGALTVQPSAASSGASCLFDTVGYYL